MTRLQTNGGFERGPLLLSQLMRCCKFDANGCWNWQYAKTTGYGRVIIGGKLTSVHRAAWECVHGPIPAGLQIDHLCRNRACCNPEHVEPVTQRENLLRGDGWAGKNASKTRCPRGHALDGIIKGGRSCRTCKRERAAIRSKAGGSISRATKSHCVNDHEMTAENTYINPRRTGAQCRICRRDAKSKANARARTAQEIA